jgi:amidase
MSRGLLASVVSMVALGIALGGQTRTPGSGTQPAAFQIVEATIPQMRDAMASGRLTSRQLVTQYLTRLGLYENRLHAAIVVNPRALEEADRLDRERAQGRIRGPLHGIPIALKDNIHTTEMPTTGGALAFAGYTPPYAATLTTNLHNAGAVIIAKTGLTELANWVAGNPTAMPGNYNAVGGFGYNPYDPRPDPREAMFDGRPGAADRRIELRDRYCGQPVGGQRRHRYRRLGDQPVERQHAGRYPADHRTHQPLRRHSDYRGSRHRRPDGPHRHRCGDSLRRAGKPGAGSTRSRHHRLHAAAGTRLHEVPEGRRAEGRAHRHPARVLLRPHHAERRSGRPAEGIGPTTGITAGAAASTRRRPRSMAAAIAVLKQQGAIVVDPADVPSLSAKEPKDNFAAWDFCSGADHARGKDENCSVDVQVRHEARLQSVARRARRVARR